MTSLVVGTFAVFGLHTLLWLPRAWQMRKEHIKVEREHANEPQYQRFSRLNRILHIIMVVSFISLALTGMTLKFSYTGWASIVSRFFGGFENLRDMSIVLLLSSSSASSLRTLSICSDDARRNSEHGRIFSSVRILSFR